MFSTLKLTRLAKLLVPKEIVSISVLHWIMYHWFSPRTHGAV